VIALIHTSYLISHSQRSDIIINIINTNEFWLKLELFYKLLKLYDYVIKILETEKTTLGQLLYIQEAAYSLFCTFYPDRNQDQFIDEWLNYTNQEGLFFVSSIKNPSFTKFLLRYWHTMLSATPNLSEFACCLLLILPNSATSEQ
ncbi:12590_t:CDS:2, partial [Cetraspora pellucida]